jgi:hypothetical protein
VTLGLLLGLGHRRKMRIAALLSSADARSAQLAMRQHDPQMDNPRPVAAAPLV